MKLLLGLFLIFGCALGCSRGGGDDEGPFLSDPGNLSGRVFDPTGGRVVGATVGIKKSDLTLSQSSTTDIDGDFFFKAIPSGEYLLEITKSGFSDFNQSVSVLPQKTASFTFTLEGVSTATLDLSGVLSENLTLDSSSPKIRIVGDLLIPKNLTLIASEGVTFEFAQKDTKNTGDFADLPEILVEGRFIASGTDVLPVTFTSISGGGLSGSWGQIKFIGGSGTSRLAGVTIDGAKIAINLDGTNTEITKNTIKNSAQEGILIQGSNNFSSISGNKITSSGGDGMRVAFSAAPVISGNTVNGSGKSGLSFFSAGGVVEANLLEKNLANGLECFNSNPSVSSNSLSLNSQNGVYLEGSAGVYGGNILTGNNGHGIRMIGTTTTVLTGNYLVQNGGAGLQSSFKTRSTIQNNLFSGNGGGGYQGDDTQNQLTNNIFSGNTGQGVLIQASSTDVLNHNVILSNSADGVKVFSSLVTLRNNIIQGNPIGLNSQGQPGPSTDFNVYFKNTKTFENSVAGPGDLIGVDPQFLNPLPGTPWLGDLNIATGSQIKFKGLGNATPGLLNPSAVTSIASSALGFSHLPR